MSSLPQAEETRTRRYRALSYTKPIDAAKETVPVIDLADRQLGPGGLRRVGKERVGRCPLPDHEDRSPSFTVNPEKNVWFCHGCLRGGDVVELARLVWDHGRHEVAMTAAQLLTEFGHEIPPRPASWHRRQSRQDPARRALKDAQARRVQRRLYRWILAPPLANITNDAERIEEAGHAWEDAGKIARQIVARAGGA